jgi:hypothetical protein
MLVVLGTWKRISLDGRQAHVIDILYFSFVIKIT